MLLDRIDGQIEPTRVVLDLHMTLRTPMVALHRERTSYSAAEVAQALDDAAPYFATHVSLSLGDTSLASRIISSTVDEPDGTSAATQRGQYQLEAGIGDLDLERTHVHVLLAYALPAGNDELPLTVSSRMLEEFEYAPGQPWEETFAVTLQTDTAHTASGVLHTGKSISLTLPRAGSRAVETPKRPYLAYFMLASVIMLGIFARIMGRRAKRRR